MNQAHTESTKFWAGGSEEFHRVRREKNLGKGIIGFMNRVMKRINLFLIAPIIII